MASGSETSEDQVHLLSETFNEGLDLYNDINNSTEATNSPSMQGKIKRSISIFEQTTRLVSYADIFSRNEGIEDVATNDIRYLMLPALLGELTLKLTSEDRSHLVEVAEIYFRDFLSRTNDYGLSNYTIKKEETQDENKPKTELESITDAVNMRANKIKQFNEKKELKSKLENLKKIVANEHADEDIKREYFITMIKSFILEAIDELNSLKTEKEILAHFKQPGSESKRPRPKESYIPLKPVIITKDAVQKAVFGAGYPSLATMTVQEFYDKRVRDGVFPDPNKRPSGPMSLQQAALQGLKVNDEDAEDEQKEELLEDDDPETIERMRRMDEFKDDHRRGWGNRMNRS